MTMEREVGRLKPPQLPAVSITRPSPVEDPDLPQHIEHSFRADVVEHVEPGPRGEVRLLGGPTLRGSVRIARARPLGVTVVPVVEQMSEARAARRSAMGSQLKAASKLFQRPDAFGEEDSVV